MKSIHVALSTAALAGCLSAVDEPRPMVGGPAGGGVELAAGGTAGGSNAGGSAGGVGAGSAGGRGDVIDGVTCADSGFCWDMPYGGTFHAVSGTSERFVVAVGEGGVIGTWNGEGFRLQPSPTKKTLRGVWFENPARGWAVGDDGVMLEWDGATWRLLPSVTTADLTSIHGAGATVFVGGVEVVLRRGNGSWAVEPSFLPIQGSPAVVRSLVVKSPTEAYLVGTASGDFFMRFDGSSWLEETLPRGARTLVALSSCGDTLFLSTAAGPHLVYSRRGGVWTERAVPGAKVACVTDASFVSYGSLPHLRSERVTLEGSATVVVSEPSNPEAVFVAGPQAVFLAGANGSFDRWQGRPLVAMEPPTLKLTVAGGAPYRLVRGDRVQRRAGAQWVDESVPGTGVITDLFSPGDGELWVMRGVDAHHLVAGQWTRHALPMGSAHVRGSSSSNVWFSGGARLARWDGATLSTEALGLGPNRLTGPVHVTATQTWVPTFSDNGIDLVWRRDAAGWRATSATGWRVWGAGDDVYFTQVSTLAKWNGASVQVLKENVETRALGVGADALYVLSVVAGSGGRYGHALSRLDLRAGREDALSLGTRARIASIDVAPTGDVWLVTDSGAVLRRAP